MKLKKMAGATLAACLLLLLMGGAARTAAQGTYRAPQVYNPNVYSRTRQTMSNRAALRAALEKKRQAAVRGGTSGGRTSSPNQTPLLGTTTFRQVADSIMPRQMALAFGRTPEEQQRFEKLFSDLLANYRAALKDIGAPPNDVSRAAAFLLISSYDVYHDNRVTISDAQINAVRQEMREVFLENETFQRLGDRERQEMFEDFGITAMWIAAGYPSVKEANDQKAMKQWRDMAKQNLLNMLGASPDKVKLTENGIEIR